MVTRQARLAAPPTAVWAQLTDPEAVATWLGDLDNQLVRGHRGRIRVDGVLHHFVAEVVEPPHRLAWRWWPLDSPDTGGSSSSVEFVLEPICGGTNLAVTERAAPRPVEFLPEGPGR